MWVVTPFDEDDGVDGDDAEDVDAEDGDGVEREAVGG